jgi:ABC-2 type transport system ATP-binding protein
VTAATVAPTDVAGTAGATAAGAIISTHGLTKVYGGRVRALDGLDLTVAPGEVVGFLGPNGAGKTTAVQLLIGAIRATGGTASVLGRPAGDRAARRWLGYLPEQFQFPGFLTPPALLDFHGRLLGVSVADRRQRATELIRLVGLEPAAKRQLKTFSKGMQQRIGLAQALIGRPRLLLLDEPTSGLDPIGTRNVRDLLLWLKAQGVAVLLNSHLLSEVELICDRVAIVNKGRVIAQGTIDELLRPVSSVNIRAEGLDEPGQAAVRGVATDLTRNDDGSWTARVGDPTDVPRLAAAIVGSGARLQALVPNHETLEEAFLRLVGYEEAPAAPARGSAAPPVPPAGFGAPRAGGDA